jgi:hypothetical protein
MADSNPSATASQQHSSNIQQLVGLLGNLMPLLVRLQSQAFEQPFRTMAGQFPGQVPGQFPGQFPAQFTGQLPMPNPVLDHQAADNMIGDMIAESLRALSAFLEANVAQHAGLENCIPIVTQAANRFAERDHTQAFNLIWQAYRVIEIIRAADPRVPLLRQSSIDQTQSSIH